MQEQHQKNQKIIVIKAKDADCRLDKFLTKELPAISRSKIKKLINEGAILINNSQVKPHYFLKVGDEVVIKPAAEAAPIAEPHTKAAAAEIPEPKIIFEDENFLVINKPAGLIVHPSPSHPKETLVNILINYFPQLKNVGEDKLRPGIVHRLDKEASGLLIIAKTQKSFEYFKKQFQDRQIKKEYLVLVHGKIKDEKGIIELPIGRLPQKGFKMSAGYFSKGKPALTEYELIKYFKDYSLLKVKTKTGRTHQIRVHLKTLGYPVVGDKIYKPRKLKVIELGRIFLHCYKIGFFDLENKWKEFEIGLDEGLKGFLDKISLPDKV